MDFTIYSKENAPEGSRVILENEENKSGFNLNFYGILAESPTSLNACVSAYTTLKESDLSDIEQEVISIIVSARNQCDYCVPVHSAVAEMVQMSEATLTELRDEKN